ncbi:MAG: OB-fold nucleic acid binding domain-containing protein, partial [Actinobacteria bacterium]|nr:OB-fold nucleic acid binding domain-containing protein [Actinomycetota bacterium]
MASLSRLAEIGTSEVKGLAGKRSSALAKAGIDSVADLLHHVPRRYIDRSMKSPIAQIPIGSEVTVIGEVRSVSMRRPRRNLAIIEARIADESATIKAVWFNQTFRKRQLTEGAQVALSGVVESFRGALQMKSPAVDVLDSPSESLITGRVVPIHGSVGEVSPGIMRRAIHNALLRSRPIEDAVPPEFI